MSLLMVLVLLWVLPSAGSILLGFVLANDDWRQARWERRKSEAREVLKAHGGHQP